jgi:hypothetical protein
MEAPKTQDMQQLLDRFTELRKQVVAMGALGEAARVELQA